MLDEDNNYYIDGAEIIELTDRETELLSILLRNKGKVVRYSELMSSCLTLASRLRKKTKIKIETIRGVGLRID